MFKEEVIAFFGASVTQQKNGYARKLTKKLCQKENIFGYGGCHLKNAGIIFINKVLEIKPTICFIEWFSTGTITSHGPSVNCILIMIK